MDEHFRSWLNQNGYGNYAGIEITPSTQLVSYTYVISLLVVTLRRHTRYYFMEAEKSKALGAKFLCIACNLILGWWGIPWGPIWTIKETICNLANTQTISWGQLIEQSANRQR